LQTQFELRDLSKNELAAETIRSFGELRLRVTGSSMLPTLRPDDELLIRQCRAEDAAPGDVVLYIRQSRLFVHRVISRCASRLVTQGDGLADADVPVSAHELLGKVVSAIRRGRPVRRESTLTLPARLAAALFRRSSHAGRFFIRLQSLQGRTGL